MVLNQYPKYPLACSYVLKLRCQGSELDSTADRKLTGRIENLANGSSCDFVGAEQLIAYLVSGTLQKGKKSFSHRFWRYISRAFKHQSHSIKNAFLLLLAITTLANCSCSRQESAEKTDPRPVRTLMTEQSVQVDESVYAGELKTRYESHLGFQISGRVLQRLVNLGDVVKSGQVLLVLDPEQEILQLSAAKADEEAARKRVAQNRIDLYRFEQLLPDQYVSQADVDRKRLALEESTAQLQAAEAHRQIMQNQQTYTELRADRDGVVSAIHAETGQVVAPGQQLVTVAAQGDMEVEISIPEGRVHEIHQADTLQISFWALPGKTYAGSLRELAPDTDSISRTYAARNSLHESDPALRLGMTASVVMRDLRDSTGIRLPLSAIHYQDGQARVWVVDKGTTTVSTRQVTLVSAQQDSVFVTSGLIANETVVTAGIHMLYPGQKVNLLDATPAATEFSLTGEFR